MTPLQSYQQQLADNKITLNLQQQEVILLLNEIYLEINSLQKKPIKNIYRRFIYKKPIRGLFLWGQVGAGKTHLVNLFHECLGENALRLHFHAFIQNIQQQLIQCQGIKNPLQIIAKNIAQKTNVLILDEFFVLNIADAMILAELLDGLFQSGVCLITTSNTEPDQLYLDGLQRENFIPAIHLLKENTHVIHLIVNQDYRQSFLRSLDTYYYPLDTHTATALNECFQKLLSSHTEQKTISTESLSLFNRLLLVRYRTPTILWCDFNDICSPPRSFQDYLILCKQYQTFIISQIPNLETVSLDQIILFITLIDILYDEKKYLIISAALPLSELYQCGRLKQRFARTESRLFEMQSSEYQIHSSQSTGPSQVF